MSVELPGPVADFLNFVGISWPNVNEDAVREMGSHIRSFASSIEATHKDATATIAAANSGYQGASYEALARRWASMSSSHVSDLVTACHGVADACDVAADVITGMKVEAIGQLGVQAAAFIADQAAAVETFGLSELAMPAIIAAGKKIVDFLKNELIQHIMGELIGKAVQPLIGTVEKAIDGLTFKAAESLLGVTDAGGGGAAASSMAVDSEALRAHSATMHQHAETVSAHAATLQANLAGVSFS
jgi:uncharacterized protein YukE